LDSGDHAAALQYAKRYESLVAQELGMAAGPEVASLIDEVRTKARAESSAAFPSQRVAHQPPLQSAPADPPPANRSTRRRSPPYAVWVLATAAVFASLVALRPTRRDATPAVAADPSIAVLPFENVSGTTEDAALADGFTEDLTAVLTRLAPLRVSPGASAFAFKNSDASAGRIGDSLGVGNILEGAWQRVGSHLRVQVRLIDARDGATRWAQTYDRQLRDIVRVQTDIADAVAHALDLHLHASTLAAIRHTSTPNIAAYELYRRGSDPALTRSDSATREGIEYFRQAIALDPGYAAAYAGLAHLYTRLGAGDDEEMAVRNRMVLAERAARKAVALDDSLGEAHLALGNVERYNLDLAGAEAEMKRAVALEPANARFREPLVFLYVLAGRDSDALTEARRAVELDPMSPNANAELAHALLASDRCDEALAQLQRLRSLRPPLLRASSYAAQCYTRRRMWPEAIAELQRAPKHGGPRGEAQLAYVLARSGRGDEARRMLATLLDRSRRIDGGAFEVAIVYVGLGEKDQAFAWLDKAVDDRSLGFDWLPTIVDDLRRDPRLERLRQRIGIQQR
jgi:TolB-like protein/Flp pilus assembly protein TadD